MDQSRCPLERATRLRPLRNGLRRWFDSYVRMRELRYQYLVAVLDGTPLPRSPRPDAARPTCTREAP